MIKHLTLKKFEVWIADLGPGNETEPGKIRPVIIVQSDLLNQLHHTSTVICPISSQERATKGRLRIFIAGSTENGLSKDSYILSDQIRAIDLNRLQEKIGVIDLETSKKLMSGIKIVLD